MPRSRTLLTLGAAFSVVMDVVARRAHEVVSRAVWFIAAGFILFGNTSDVAATTLPNPGTHLFESDFLGSSSETYNDDTVRALVEGWTGQRSGDH